MKESQVCNGDHTRATELELYYVYVFGSSLSCTYVHMYVRTYIDMHGLVHFFQN